MRGTTVTQPLAGGLPAGAYTVEWRVTSADGHPLSGTFGFTVAQGAATQPAAGAAGPVTTVDRRRPPSDPGRRRRSPWSGSSSARSWPSASASSCASCGDRRDRRRPAAASRPRGRRPARRRVPRAAAVAAGCRRRWSSSSCVALTVGGGPPGVGGLDRAGPARRLGACRSPGSSARIAALGTVGALLFAAVLRPAAPAAGRVPAGAAGGVGLGDRVGRRDGDPRPAHAGPAGRRLGHASSALGSSSPTSPPGGPRSSSSPPRCSWPCWPAAAPRHVRRRRLLLAVAVAGLVVPVVLTGHSAAADDHVLAVTNLSVHVVAASVWVGGLLALLVHGRGRDDLAPGGGPLQRRGPGLLPRHRALGSAGRLARPRRRPPTGCPARSAPGTAGCCSPRPRR